MTTQRSKSKNEVLRMTLIREKDDGVYLVTVTFPPGQGPIVELDEAGTPRNLTGGGYKIKKATWNNYNTRGKGAYIQPDTPLRNFGRGAVTACKVLDIGGEMAYTWDRVDDFVFVGPGIKTHVKKMDESKYRLEEATKLFRRDHPRTTRKGALTRVRQIIQKAIPKKQRTYKPTGKKRGAPFSLFTVEANKLIERGHSRQEVQKRMAAWHHQNFPSGHPKYRDQKSISRSVRRLFARKKMTSKSS